MFLKFSNSTPESFTMIDLKKQMLILEGKMLYCLEVMEEYHYSNGKYIDAEVNLNRYNDAWQSLYSQQFNSND